MRRSYLILLALCCVVAGTVDAKGKKKSAAKPKVPTFKQLDKDNDKKLTRKECNAHKPLRKVFGRKDRNHDGFLTPQEMSKKL